VKAIRMDFYDSVLAEENKHTHTHTQNKLLFNFVETEPELVYIFSLSSLFFKIPKHSPSLPLRSRELLDAASKQPTKKRSNVE